MQISVIMPVKNCAKYLRRALDSLKKQSNYKVLVCDGGSTDGTLDILKEYEIIPVSYTDTSGADAMNKGIKLATSDIITWFMGDDELLDNSFETIINFFQTNPGVIWAYSPCEIRYETGGYEMMGDDPDVTLEKMLHKNLISGIAIYFRPEFFKKYGYIDESYQYANDYELWLRALSMGAKPVQIPQRTVVYHAHGDNLGLRPEGNNECLKLREKYAQR